MTEREFRERVLSLRRLMYGVALKMGIPPDDAADAVQEALVKLWRHRDGIPGNPGESRLYCMAALRNECLSLIRRRPPASAASAGIPLEEAADVKAPPRQRHRSGGRIQRHPPAYRDTHRHAAARSARRHKDERLRRTRQLRDSRSHRADREQCAPAPFARPATTQGIA